MNPDATLCTSGGRFSAPAALPGDGRTSAAPIDRANTAIARWQASSPIARRLGRGIDVPAPALPASARKALGIGLLAFGSVLLTMWVGPSANFIAGRYGLGAAITGLALLLFDRIVRPAVDLERPGPAPAHLPAIRWLGRDSNLVAAQLFVAAHLVDRAYWLQVDAARTAAVIVVALAALLWPSRARLGPMLLAGAAVLYAIWVTIRLTEFSFWAATGMPEFDLIVPLRPVFWALAAIAVFPQLQLVRWGRLRVGGFVGDVVIDRGGNPVLLAFGSAVLIAASATAFFAVLNTWGWIGVLTR